MLPVIFSLLEDPTAQRLACLKARPKLWRACLFIQNLWISTFHCPNSARSSRSRYPKSGPLRHNPNSPPGIDPLPS
jgi:hypothetical protein